MVRSLTLALTAVAVLFTSVAVPSRPAAAAGGTCTEYAVAVPLTDGGPLDQTVRGDLCLPRFGAPRTVQVLVHGGSYDRTYWDFPYMPQLYSYVRYANAAGYATFNVDSIGSGTSSHPDSSQVTMATAAAALHQVITRLRAGSIGSVAFDNVIYVGHSFGVSIGWTLAGTHGSDVDGFIATGAPHAISATAVGGLAGAAFPASQDPKFAALGLDPGYLSAPAESRQIAFYHEPTSDQRAIATDYATRDSFSVGTLLTGLPLFVIPPALSPTLALTGPVLSIFGGNDFLFCQPDALDCTDHAGIRQHEAAYYPHASSFRLVIVPRTGHSLNTHYTAPLSFVTMLGWARAHIAP